MAKKKVREEEAEGKGKSPLEAMYARLVTGEIGEDEIKEVVKGLGDDEAERLRTVVLVLLARQDEGVEGFGAFYELVHGRRMPGHVRRWIEFIFDSYREEWEGTVIWSWRGSWKSTTISVTFLAYWIGQHPELTNLVVGANDDSAEKITGAIAVLIDSNPVWKLVYPHVVADKGRGWGAEGYWVRDGRYGVEEWAARQAKVIDPSLLGAGVNSSRLIGKHPTGVIDLDDVHDEKNSISQRERAAVVKIISDTILPMAVRDEKTKKLKTRIIAVGTPWDEDDGYHYLVNTGVFAHLSTPVMVRSEEGKGVWVDGRNRDGVVFEDLVGWWALTDPARYTAEVVVADRAKSGQRGFARMYLLDLKAVLNKGLRYYTYPHEEIELEWPMGGGCDFATVLEAGRVNQPGRDYFSIAYGALTPRGKVVVVDGIFEQCTQAQAETHLEKPQSLYRNWIQTVFEGDGAGEQFFVNITRRKPGLRIVMKKTGGKNKRYRQEQVMGPWLENGTVLVSDADTPYLNALRRALDDFPDGNNDIRDGLYWLLHVFPGALVVPEAEKVVDLRKRRREAEENRHPAYAFGRK